MPVEVHFESLQKRFIAPWCSIACFINFVIIVGAAILPLYIGWASHSFWIKETWRWEQPSITYKNEFILSLHGYKGTLGQQVPFTILWSSSPAANDYYGQTARSSVVKSSARDTNLDGIVDELYFSAAVPLQTDEVITSAKAILYVDAELKTITRAKFDALLVAEHNSAVSGSTFIADGDVAFRQRDSMPFAPGGIYMPYLATPFTQLSAVTNAQQADPEAVLAFYRQRNHTVELQVPYPEWSFERGYVPNTPGALSDYTTASILPRNFKLKMIARIPSTAVRIRPGVAEELKHGWIQYVSFLVVTVAAAWVLRKIIFGYHVLETSIFVDGPRSKVHLE